MAVAVVNLRKCNVGFLSQTEKIGFAKFDFDACSGVRKDSISTQEREVRSQLFPIHLPGRYIGCRSFNMADAGRVLVRSQDRS
jgi:hypothetical protein